MRTAFLVISLYYREWVAATFFSLLDFKIYKGKHDPDYWLPWKEADFLDNFGGIFHVWSINA